jgi:23S rRNA pseudouridine1911/1915/1917 synthase
MTLIVDDAAGATRLDAFLARRFPLLPHRLVRRIIAEGGVRVNGRPGAKGVRLRAGDRVSLPDLPAALAPEPALALPIVHEDEHVVAIDKPGGMPSHALDPRQTGTAAAFVLARYPETAGVGDLLAPGLVHRLDTGTSGLLLAARTAEAHAALRMALRARTVDKRYLALVAGRAEHLDGARIDTPLRHDRRDARRMAPAGPGARSWPAVTELRVLRAAGDATLVEARILTGVTHQVRAHLALARHPVLNDLLYGGPATGLPPERHALHASTLAFPHPAHRGTVVLRSPLPPDLEALLAESR